MVLISSSSLLLSTYSTVILVLLVHAVSIMTGADRKVKQTKLVDRLNCFCCFSRCKCIASYSSWPVLLSVLLLFPVAVHTSTPSPLSVVTVWVYGFAKDVDTQCCCQCCCCSQQLCTVILLSCCLLLLCGYKALLKTLIKDPFRPYGWWGLWISCGQTSPS